MLQGPDQPSGPPGHRPAPRHQRPARPPACTLHCAFTNWPYDPHGRYDTGAGQIGTGRDHADDWGIYTVYRIFGIDLERRRAWGDLEAEILPHAAALTGYVARPPQRSRPDQPHLYRFWNDLARLHTAQLTHAADTGQCTHSLVRGGRVLVAPTGH
ncbi:hypothetical protein [Streptomyces zhihengii]|uniref:hypothetical protein n=1 Tax=Streptomyces zhihengii TaxID=1818004 RepID=UPI0033B8AFE7